MYGGYGGMGGVGGYSSYGGGGMGSYGMGGYGSSLGSGLGSTFGSSLAQNQLKGKVPPVDPNNPQQQKQNEQINHRKMFFQQWFKMMGGLRSILQLGFAGIALANFWSKGTQIFKKLLQFLKQTGKSLASFIESKIPTKIFSNLSQPQKRGKVLKSIIMGLVRIFALILLCIGIKLKQQIVMQAKKKSEQMKIQLQKLKNSQRQMQEDDQFENRVPEIMGTEANL